MIFTFIEMRPQAPCWTVVTLPVSPAHPRQLRGTYASASVSHFWRCISHSFVSTNSMRPASVATLPVTPNHGRQIRYNSGPLRTFAGHLPTWRHLSLRPRYRSPKSSSMLAMNVPGQSWVVLGSSNSHWSALLRPRNVLKSKPHRSERNAILDVCGVPHCYLVLWLSALQPHDRKTFMFHAFCSSVVIRDMLINFKWSQTKRPPALPVTCYFALRRAPVTPCPMFTHSTAVDNVRQASIFAPWR